MLRAHSTRAWAMAAAILLSSLLAAGCGDLGGTPPLSSPPASRAAAQPDISTLITGVSTVSGTPGTLAANGMFAGQLQAPTLTPSSLAGQAGSSLYLAVSSRSAAYHIRLSLQGYTSFYDVDVHTSSQPYQLSITTSVSAPASPLTLSVETLNNTGAPSILATASLQLTPPPANSPSGGAGSGGQLQDLSWPKFHADAENTGLRFGGNQTTGQLAWKFQTKGKIVSSPAIGNYGIVYFGASDLNLYAVRAATGKLVWSFKAGNTITGGVAIGNDGTIYTGCSDGNIYALDGYTGVRKWSFQTGAPVTTAPAFGNNGVVFILTNSDVVYALNGTTGARIWSAQLGKVSAGQYSFACCAWLKKTSVLYVGGLDGLVYALNDSTGQKVWSYKTNGPIVSSPAINTTNNYLYIGSNDDNVYALDAAKGGLKWKFATQGAVESSPAIGSDGTIYVGSDDSNLYAIDGSAGVQKWAYQTGSKVDSSPAIDPNGIIYVGSEDRSLYALDSNNSGALKWSYRTGDVIRYCSPAIRYNNHIFFGSFDGYFYSLQ